MTRIDFSTCKVEWWPEQRKCVTEFPDGTQAHAVPHATLEYLGHAISKSTGDVDLYCFQHDIAHVVVALPEPSVVLWRLAHGLSTDTPECDAEERAAQDFQRKLFLR